MIYFRRLLIISFLVALCLTFFPSEVMVRSQGEVPTTVLVVYDCEISDPVLNIIKELFGAYNAKGYFINENDYVKDKMSNYNRVMIVSKNNKIINDDLIIDLKQYNEKIFWIGRGINKILDIESKHIIIDENKKIQIKSISYYNKDYDVWNVKKTKENNNTFTIADSHKLDNVYSYMTDGKENYANIWTKDNLFNMAIIPTDKISIFILSDILNNYFSIEDIGSGSVFIKIENVHVFRDIVKLKEITDYLFVENVPFIISLTPNYLDSDTGYINTFSKSPDFIDIIKYMQDKGGSVIISDEEFGVAIEECVNNGVYPLGLDIPKDSSSLATKNVKKNFSTFIGNYCVGDLMVEYPYFLKNIDNYSIYLPQNLGDINTNDIEWLLPIKENFETLTLVRGYCGGIGFDPYLDIEYLMELIEFFKINNVKFMNIRDLDNWIKWNNITITSSKGQIDVNGNKFKDIYENGNLSDKSNNDNEAYFNKINSILTALLIVMLVILGMVIWYYKKQVVKK